MKAHPDPPPDGVSSRRRFLQQSALTVSAAALASAAAAELPGSEPQPTRSDKTSNGAIVDCHAHIYGEDEAKYPPIEKPYRPPAGKGTVAHLRQEIQRAGVQSVTAIHTSTFYRWDNRFTAAAAREHRDIMIGVCTLDPDDEQSATTLERYVRESNVRGMRSIPAQSGKLDDPGVERLWATAERLGIVINVLVNRDKRPELEILARRHRELRIVIDHCLNLKAGPDLEATLRDMVALAELPNLHAKLSFLPTGSAEDYPCRDMHAACLAVIDAFGPDRCVWGSDFPCELWCPKVTYEQHLRIMTDELSLSAATQKSILCDTPHRLWFAN